MARISAKAIADPALLEDRVSSMPGFDPRINRYMPLADGTVPDVVISFAAPDKGTSVLVEQLTDPLFIFGHYNASLSCRSD